MTLATGSCGVQNEGGHDGSRRILGVVCRTYVSRSYAAIVQHDTRYRYTLYCHLSLPSHVCEFSSKEPPSDGEPKFGTIGRATVVRHKYGSIATITRPSHLDSAIIR